MKHDRIAAYANHMHVEEWEDASPLGGVFSLPVAWKLGADEDGFYTATLWGGWIGDKRLDRAFFVEAYGEDHVASCEANMADRFDRGAYPNEPVHTGAAA